MKNIFSIEIKDNENSKMVGEHFITKKIDDELIRNYKDFYRADIVGISASKHEVKVVPVVNNQEKIDNATTFEATQKLMLEKVFHSITTL